MHEVVSHRASETLPARLEREGKLGVPQRVPLTVNGAERNAKGIRINLGQLWNVICNLRHNHIKSVSSISSPCTRKQIMPTQTRKKSSYSFNAKVQKRVQINVVLEGSLSHLSLCDRFCGFKEVINVWSETLKFRDDKLMTESSWNQNNVVYDDAEIDSFISDTNRKKNADKLFELFSIDD